MNPDYAKFDEEYNSQLLATFSLPPALMEGVNYSSSRVALEMFEKRLGLSPQSQVGGSWIGEDNYG